MRNFHTTRFLLLGVLCVSLGACATPKTQQPAAERDLLIIAESTGFELVPESALERSFLEFILPPEEKDILRSVVLLREGDRVTSAYFVRSFSSPQHFLTLKERTFDLFSSQMSGLIDERVTREGYLPMDIFSFTDPVLGEDRFLFALIGETLYEFHVAPEKENVVQGLLLEVARKE